MKPTSITLVFENCEAMDINMEHVLFYILDEGEGCSVSERTLNSFTFVFKEETPCDTNVSSYARIDLRLNHRDVTWVELVYPDNTMIRYYVPWPEGYDYTHPEQTCYRSHYNVLFQQGNLVEYKYLDRIAKYI